MRRTYLIGDIHGCHKELLELEAVAREHARGAFVPSGEVRFVSVGDLVDRGPDSAAVVEHYLRGLKAKTHRAVYGNHEAMMINVFWDQRPDLMHAAGLGSAKSGSALAWNVKEEFGARREQLSAAGIHTEADFIEHETFNWIIQGGRETLQSMGCVANRPESWSPALPLLKYVAKLPLYWRNGKVVVTHALMTRAELALVARGASIKKKNKTRRLKAPVAKPKWTPAVIKAARSAMWSRAIPPARPDPQRIHVSGHTPMKEVGQPMDGIVRIDTGCVYGERLTAYCVETGEILSVASQTKWKQQS